MLVYTEERDLDPAQVEPADALLQEIEVMRVSANLKRLKGLYPFDAMNDLRCGWSHGSAYSGSSKHSPTYRFDELKEALYVKSTRVILLDRQDITLPAGTNFRVAGTSVETHPSKPTKYSSDTDVVVERIVLTALHPEDPNRTINYLYKRGSLVGNLFEPIRNEMAVIAIAATGL